MFAALSSVVEADLSDDGATDAADAAAEPASPSRDWGLGVLVLASFVSRSLGDADQIAVQPVVRMPHPGSASSALVLPEVTRSTTAPILPRRC